MSVFPRPILAVHQPNYAPWLGYFVKLAVADIFVLLDVVQFPKASYVNRTRIYGPHGPEYLTVPVRHPGLRAIRDVRIADPRWAEQHRRRLRAFYHGTSGLALAEAALAPEGLDGIESLAEANEVVLRRISPLLGLQRDPRRASGLGLLAEDPTDRHIELCRKLGARTYLSGRGAGAYNEPARFEAAGLRLGYLGFDHPSYPQPGSEFVPGLSALDFICATGAAAADGLRQVVANAWIEDVAAERPQ